MRASVSPPVFAPPASSPGRGHSQATKSASTTSSASRRSRATVREVGPRVRLSDPSVTPRKYADRVRRGRTAPPGDGTTRRRDGSVRERAQRLGVQHVDVAQAVAGGPDALDELLVFQLFRQWLVTETSAASEEEQRTVRRQPGRELPPGRVQRRAG